MPTISIS
ncbi:hypothetical protein VTL71DRAFT_10784 [Oculimacula yallundae]